MSSTPLFGFEKTLVDDDNTISFNLWMSKHGKSYRSIAEQHVRQGVFISNIARWSLLNKIPGGASYGPEDEQYADLTPEEFVRVSTCVGTMASPGSFLSDDGENIESVPIFQQQRSHRRTNTIMLVDWRNVDGVSYVTPVKNQGPHGTCWSFGAAENLEGLNVRQGYPLVNISEQEFISCCSECQGASADATFEWLVNNTDGRPALEDGYPVSFEGINPLHVQSPHY